jgi:hypothetical protein
MIATVKNPRKLQRQIEPACYLPVALGAAIPFLGRDTESGRWVIWWGEYDGQGGAWYDTAGEAWGALHALIA